MYNLNLKDKFAQHLANSSQQHFTTRDALLWYKQNKINPNQVDYSNLYTLIINPLLAEGKIRKILKGLYEVIIPGKQYDDHTHQLDGIDIQESLSQEEREFLEYLKSKGVT
jgi:hypothetical protein